MDRSINTVTNTSSLAGGQQDRKKVRNREVSDLEAWGQGQQAVSSKERKLRPTQGQIAQGGDVKM